MVRWALVLVPPDLVPGDTPCVPWYHYPVTPPKEVEVKMTESSARFDAYAYGDALTFGDDDNNDFQLPHNFDNTDDLSSLLGNGA